MTIKRTNNHSHSSSLNQVFGPALAASAPGGLLRAMKMTLFDAFINAPLIWLPPAYIAQAVVYRYPKREAIQKYIVDVRENGLLTKYWSLWLPMSMINFAFVPVHFRVAFVAAVVSSACLFVQRCVDVIENMMSCVFSSVVYDCGIYMAFNSNHIIHPFSLQSVSNKTTISLSLFLLFL